MKPAVVLEISPSFRGVIHRPIFMACWASACPLPGAQKNGMLVPSSLIAGEVHRIFLIAG